MLCIFPVRVTPLPSATLLARKRRGRPSGRRSRRAAISNISLREMALSDPYRLRNGRAIANGCYGKSGGSQISPAGIGSCQRLSHKSITACTAPFRMPIHVSRHDLCDGARVEMILRHA